MTWKILEDGLNYMPKNPLIRRYNITRFLIPVAILCWFLAECCSNILINYR